MPVWNNYSCFIRQHSAGLPAGVVFRMNNQPLNSTWERWVTHLCGGIAAAILFFMMALTFVDVILRYWFDAPIPGGFEVTELLLASLIYCGLPLVTIRREHVSVDLFDQFIPAALHRVRDLAVQVVCTICITTLAWLMWRKARESQGYGDITSVLEIELAPVFFLGALMFVLTAVVFLVLLKRSLCDSSSIESASD